jgi:hypothetical protein
MSTTPTRLALAAITLIAPAFAPAYAQETIGTLQVQGQVMTSTGGEFAAAASGEPVVAGERIMVGEGGQATVQLSNGTVLSYTQPGVYTVQLPAAAAATAATATQVASPAVGLSATTIAIGAGLAAAVVVSTNDGDDTPVSR